MAFWDQPIFGVGITLIPYIVLYLLSKRINWVHPLILTTGFIIIFLLLFNIPYESYSKGGDIITFMLAPATVALGVPVYREGKKIKQSLAPIILGNFTGSLMGILSGGGLIWLLGGGKELILSMMPKSATTPISVVIVENLGGLPPLGATFTVLTGLLGSLAGPWFLDKCGIQGDIAKGAAMGTAAHGIGTAKALEYSQLQGSISAFSMGVTGILTSILVIPLYYLL